jgi:large subunit ribosomal protein L4e
MAKVKIMTAENHEAGSIDLPVQFSEDVRTDLISRSVLAIQAANRQPYGGYGDAGMRHSSKLSRRRRDYRGSYGMGISRVPRKIISRRGRRMNWVGALSPGTVGGRRAHGPKPQAEWDQKVNVAENRKAIRSALAATMQKDVVAQRGHLLPPSFPFIVDNTFEDLTRTTELEAALVKLGFAPELERAGVTRIASGRAKTRGRRYKTPTSFLFVVSKDATKLVKAAANLPGSDVVSVHRVNAELLAPGTHPGRLTIYTKAAVERLANEGLFTKSYKGAKVEKSPAKAAKTEAPAEKKAAPKKASAPKASAKKEK